MNFANKRRELSSNLLKFFAPLLLILSACNWYSGEPELRSQFIQRTDSLWALMNDTRDKFTYNYVDIMDRKEDMDSFNKMMKFIPSERINEQTQGLLNQYVAVLRVYKSLAGEYKNAVLESEDIFYQIKSLEKLVKKGDYDKKPDDFKKEYAELNKEIRHIREEAEEITEKLNSVEPVYLRVSEQAETFISAATPRY